jgi:acyl dehydratase
MVSRACDGEPERLRSLGARFTNVVYPGDTITTEGWRVTGGRYLFRTVNQDGTTVLGDGLATVTA